MTRPELGKPPEPAASPDSSPQPAAPGQRVKAAPSASTEPASARPARGRGEPQRPSSPSRSSGAAHEAVQNPARASTPAVELSSPAAASAPFSTEDEDLAEDSALEYPSSRLSGLRTLLVSLGRRSLNQEMDPGAESDSAVEPHFQRSAPHPVSNAQEEFVPGNGAPARLTAQPEFLPPRPMVELEAEREKEAVRATPTRRDTPEGDEIQTLPSWRGQYRKKRYPPV